MDRKRGSKQKKRNEKKCAPERASQREEHSNAVFVAERQGKTAGAAARDTASGAYRDENSATWDVAWEGHGQVARNCEAQAEAT